jgi:hypothetical protein
VRRRLLWTALIGATLVVVAVAVQVYLAAAFVFGADALVAHRRVGDVTLLLQGVVFVAVAWAHRGRWSETLVALALPVVGIVQVAFAGGSAWSGGLHGLLAILVLVLAAVIAHRAMHELGLGRRGRPQDAG